MRELTSQHEAPRDEPWSVDDAPRDFVEQMLRAIVGVSIEVTSDEAKFKLSQNRADPDRSGVGDDLGRGDDRQRAVAAVMAAAERRRSTAG